MSNIQVSLFASSNRENLYEAFFDSLKDTSVSWEVVFAGEEPPKKIYPNFRYIPTKRIKVAQIYEVARRYCEGEVVMWTADDAEHKGDIIGKAYRYWKERGNEKLILSLQTREADAFRGGMHLVPMKVHSFFGGRPQSGLMAPLGLMSREYLDNLGGFHRDFIGNQAENDVVMNAYADGGTVEIFGDKSAYIELDHHAKHGGPRVLNTFYRHDRKILESAWVKDKQIMKERQTPFIPYNNEGILTESQGNREGWNHD